MKNDEADDDAYNKEVEEEEVEEGERVGFLTCFV
jgi:hypothetical protein